jgi:hypothetical protein
MHRRLHLWVPAIGMLGAIATLSRSAPVQAGAFVESHVLVTGGQLNCSTGGGETFAGNAAANFFAAGNARGATVPAPSLAACSEPANIDTQTAASGPVSDSASLPNTITNFSSSVGSAQAHANAGGPGTVAAVGAAASMTTSLLAPSAGVFDPSADAYGVVSQPITFFSPSLGAGAGYATINIAIDGSMLDTVANGDAILLALYQQDNGIAYDFLNADINLSGNHVNCIGDPGCAGFTIAPGSFAGSATFVTVDLPFTNGVPFDFTYGLLATVFPAQSGTVDQVDFNSTAALTGFSVFNAQGTPLTDFTATLGSGAVYDASGIEAAGPTNVPEPSSLAVLGPSLALFGLIRMRPLGRRRDVAPTAS